MLGWRNRTNRSHRSALNGGAIHLTSASGRRLRGAVLSLIPVVAAPSEQQPERRAEMSREKQVHDIWWNLLRTRMRQVPQKERQFWTETDIAEWLVKFSLDPVVREKTEPLPSVEHVQKVCSDLIGPHTIE